MVDWSKSFSDRSNRMKPSPIRLLLALTAKPEIISFAGGLPDPASFPVEQFSECMSHVLATNSKQVLQYGETPGFKPLREQIAQMSAKEGIEDCTIDNVCVTTSSQQGIDLVGKVFINDGDTVIVEGPTYLAALQSWNVYGAKYVSVKLDDDGMKVDILEQKLAQLESQGIKPKFIYTIPTFQNPSGITMTMERRKKLLELAYKYEVPIIEDNPYGDLRFSGETLPPLAAMDTKGMVIYLRTFSKIMFPGIRLGWIVANKDVLQKLILAKEPSDLCTPVITQAAVAEFIKRGYVDAHIPKIIKSYSNKRQVMEEALKKNFPPDVKWTKAEGGMFVWVTLPEKFNTSEMFQKAIDNKVAYIVGSAFYTDGLGTNEMRLNFSFPTPEQIEEGIARLANLLK